MDVRLAADHEKQRWNEVALNSKTGSFLQSWEWGDAQKTFGLDVTRLVVEEGGEFMAVGMVLRRNAFLGRSWLYLPRGPVVKPERLHEASLWKAMTDKLSALGAAERSLFVRCDPYIEEGGIESEIKAAGWKASEREVQPKHTVVIDLSLPEDQLLSAMHSKTRYNVRLADRKGVTIRFSKDERDLNHFFTLASDVSSRSSFRFHPDEYYKAMLNVLGSSDMFEVAIAEHEGQVLAAHLIVYAGEVATYVHGASSSAKRSLMAPALLQWETMRRAKDKGCLLYDLFGVAPDGAGSDHPWSGITRFKEGFGGRRVSLIGAFDLVLNEGLYTIFTAARRMRGLVR